MPKSIYANYITYNNSQIKAENIYMAPTYINSRLGLGIYSQYIYRESDLEACTQSIADKYVYISLNLGTQG